MWKQHNFLTLPNFALLVLVSFGRNWRNVPLHINLPASSSRVKFFSWCVWCPHHISPYSILFLLLSSPVLENTLHSSAGAKYPLLFTSPSGNSSLAALRHESIATESHQYLTKLLLLVCCSPFDLAVFCSQTCAA